MPGAPVKVDEEAYIARHPLVGRLAQRLIWLGIGADGAGSPASPLKTEPTACRRRSCRPVVDGGGAAAHQSLLDRPIAAWQRHLADYEAAAAFDQIGRTLPTLGKDQHRMRDIRDREGWMIETFKLGIATKLGYIRGAAGDGGGSRATSAYRGMGVVAQTEFTGARCLRQCAGGADLDQLSPT